MSSKEEIRQQLINGLSFDTNTFFVSNKGLTKDIRETLEKCNNYRLGDRDIKSPFLTLKEQFDEHGLPVIREVLSNSYLITDLHKWKAGLLAENSILDGLVKKFHRHEYRKSILLELSVYANSNFESVTFFIRTFFTELATKKGLLMSVLKQDDNGIHNEFYEYSFAHLTYMVSKTRHKRHNNYFNKYLKGISPDKCKQFYVFSVPEYQKLGEIEKIEHHLVVFIIKKSRTHLASILMPTLKKGGSEIKTKLFEKFTTIDEKYYHFWVKDYSSSFIGWAKKQQKISEKYIRFIEECLKKGIPVSDKQLLVSLFRNTNFYTEKNKKKYLSEFMRNIQTNKQRLEHDVFIAIKDYLSPNKKIQQPQNKKLPPEIYDSLIENIRNKNFRLLYDTLNKFTNVLDFIKHVKSIQDKTLQESFTQFLDLKWKK